LYGGSKITIILFLLVWPALPTVFLPKKLNVIGVTGTDGKTTTSTLIYHLLKHAGYKVALISTVAAYVGDKQIDTGFHVTSPMSGSCKN
jgi:UDP-N-acetylmuramoyl-L-alanyl-D-glutamate--2,6-diaminopimelate ligase